jgi:diguanylate cyclase (GGDEF)-like protein
MEKLDMVVELSFLDIFKNVSMESITSLLDGCHYKKFSAGETVIDSGETSSVLYLLVDGELIVKVENVQTAILTAGQTVRELSVLDGGVNSVNVVAKSESRLFIIPNEQLWCLIDVSHEFSKNLFMEFSKRLQNNNSSIGENSQLQQRFEREEKIDALTSLRNRRWLDVSLPKLINRLDFDKKNLSAIMINIDNFKSVNEEYGHLIGDEVISLVASEITNSLRPTDFGCRYGGVEFVAILPDSNSEGSHIAAERLRESVENLFKKLHKEISMPEITISLGVATSFEDITAHSLIHSADEALSFAKVAGRNTVVRAGEVTF